MNKHLLSLLATFALAVAARAETSVTLSDVHLCCKSCVTGAEKAVAKVSGATATVDQDAETVAIKAPDAPTAQKAVDSLIAAGYFGASTDPVIKVKDTSGAKDAKVTKLAVNDVHLCCKKCVTAVSKAVSSVKGVTGNTAEKGAKTFEVTGDFSPKEVFTALQKEGLTGKAGN
jgi:periplasmic mercuric ion binding protein